MPIQRHEVDRQTTVNGVDPSVLDGHLWAFLNLNLTHQAKEVFNNVPSMHGLEVWRRLIGELFSLTDLRQMDLQSVVYAPVQATSVQRIRSAIESWETNLRKYEEVDGHVNEKAKKNIFLKILPRVLAEQLILSSQNNTQTYFAVSYTHLTLPTIYSV